MPTVLFVFICKDPNTGPISQLSVLYMCIHTINTKANEKWQTTKQVEFCCTQLTSQDFGIINENKECKLDTIQSDAISAHNNVYNYRATFNDYLCNQNSNDSETISDDDDDTVSISSTASQQSVVIHESNDRLRKDEEQTESKEEKEWKSNETDTNDTTIDNNASIVDINSTIKIPNCKTKNKLAVKKCKLDVKFEINFMLQKAIIYQASAINTILFKELIQYFGKWVINANIMLENTFIFPYASESNLEMISIFNEYFIKTSSNNATHQNQKQSIKKEDKTTTIQKQPKLIDLVLFAKDNIVSLRIDGDMYLNRKKTFTIMDLADFDRCYSLMGHIADYCDDSEIETRFLKNNLKYKTTISKRSQLRHYKGKICSKEDIKQLETIIRSSLMPKLRTHYRGVRKYQGFNFYEMYCLATKLTTFDHICDKLELKNSNNNENKQNEKKTKRGCRE